MRREIKKKRHHNKVYSAFLRDTQHIQAVGQHKQITKMKKLITISIAILLFGCSSESDNSNVEADNKVDEKVIEEKPIEFNFRKTVWGMSMKDVIEAEGKPDVQRKNTIMYSAPDIGGKDAVIIYLFHAKKLIKGFYVFGMKNSMKLEYVAGFNQVYEMLNSKYGEPNELNDVWTDEETKVKYEGGTEPPLLAVA